MPWLNFEFWVFSQLHWVAHGSPTESVHIYLGNDCWVMLLHSYFFIWHVINGRFFLDSYWINLYVNELGRSNRSTLFTTTGGSDFPAEYHLLISSNHSHSWRNNRSFSIFLKDEETLKLQGPRVESLTSPLLYPLSYSRPLRNWWESVMMLSILPQLFYRFERIHSLGIKFELSSVWILTLRSTNRMKILDIKRFLFSTLLHRFTLTSPLVLFLRLGPVCLIASADILLRDTLMQLQSLCKLCDLICQCGHCQCPVL